MIHISLHSHSFLW